jgi:hypothetical protein
MSRPTLCENPIEVKIRLPQAIWNALPDGKRSTWCREAIIEKAKKEGVKDGRKG